MRSFSSRCREAWSTARRRAVIGGVVALLWLMLSADAMAADGVVQLPVSFAVQNTNTSGVSCPSDGARYTVRGHIAAPTALRAAGKPAISVYLTGLEVGEWNWAFTSVPGYDWPVEMAKLGQVSLTIDQLGYGPSGHPPGDYSCYGSQADVAHQIIGELRRGDYQVAGGVPVRFERIVRVGHDVGGAFAQIEAYSYHDIDGLIVLTWSDQGQTPLILERSMRAAPTCSSGGEQAYPGGPGGYFFIERPEEYQPDLFYNFDPAVLNAFVRLRERNPCGYEPTTLAAIGTDLARLGEIHIPVLLAIGANDKIFTQDGWSQQQGHFTGSGDVTAVSLADTGHYPMLERTAPQARALVAGWLSRRGFGSTTPPITSPQQPAAAPLRLAPPLLNIGQQTVRIRHNHIARVRVTCVAPSGTQCAGTLRLQTKRRNGRQAGGVVASRKFRITAGPTTVDARLVRRAYEHLKHQRRIRVYAIATQPSNSGGVSSVRTLITLRAMR